MTWLAVAPAGAAVALAVLVAAFAGLALRRQFSATAMSPEEAGRHVARAAHRRASRKRPWHGVDGAAQLLEQYAVHGDRFLVLRPSKDSAPQTIAVIGNWPSLLSRPAGSNPRR